MKMAVLFLVKNDMHFKLCHLTLMANGWLYFATMFIKLPTDAAVKRTRSRGETVEENK